MHKMLEVKNMTQSFNLTKGFFDKYKLKGGKIVREERLVHAVNGVSFEIEQGKVFSLVGESGCGKSTTARTIIKLLEPESGEIIFDGLDITNLKRKEMQPIRRNMQMIFQDPYASLNPRAQIKKIVMEPILFHNKNMTWKEGEKKALELLEIVGLRTEQANRYPHQFSGGQRQRIGIARALAVRPKLIIADEPVSALDVSIQAQILNLLMDLKDEFQLSYLFIAHDLSVVKHISDGIGVMYLGRIVEKGDTKDIFRNPSHPYTKLLLSSIPTINEEHLVEPMEIIGEIPSPIHLPSGCHFHDRCNYAMEKCSKEPPTEIEIEPGHFVSCHLLG
ncbi:MAG: dipeptide ABC transporter ATP-binding protein [Dethiosulfatibacter sp.]|nr:dipeptide ABC transporter ATP-binding protein [Dethiosulfatibacter sp.]